jgi:WD40 repeat protein
MARVFVSHSGKDAALVADVHRWLVDDGHEAFLDQHLSDGLLVGEEWEKRLRERLRWADAVVCVLTSAYLASVWCTAELTLAQSWGSRLLPVQAEPGVRHPLLNSVQYVDMTTDAAAARARMAEALLRVDAAGGAGWPDDRSPFPGLRPLDTDEHSVFFGRAREVDELATLLRSPAERAHPAVLVVVGPSGCGKSSLVRAGLLPVMAAEPEWWTLPAILPGTQPVAALARELAATARLLGMPWTVTNVRCRLDDGDLSGLVDDLLLAVPGHRRRHLLIVVDQFEELLTQTSLEQRTRFAGLLGDALTGPVQVVATLRPEFLDQLLASPELSALPARTYAVRPLRPEALRAVIERPADRAGIGIDADLVARLVADTGGGDALPLLAYTLAQLTDGIARGECISITRYEQLSGVQGALAGQADAALAEAVTAGGRNRDQVLRELLRLVTVDEQGRPTRWRIRREELPGQVRIELQPFVDRRLLTTDTEHDHVVLGVAHEAFLSAWPPLERAITASAAALRARRQVEQAAAEWAEQGHAPARLWERGQLAAALADTGAHVRTGVTTHETAAPESVSAPEPELGKRRPRRRRTLVADRVEFSARARDFLRASIRRDRRRRGRAITILSMLLVLALGAAVVAFGQQRLAEERHRLATARLLLPQAEAALNTDPRTALRLNEAAQYIHPDAETRSALKYNLLTTAYAGSLTGHTDAVEAAAFAPTGDILASAGDDGSVLLWDVGDPAAAQQLGDPLTASTGTVEAVAFAPDGHTLATGSWDGSVLLWKVSDRAAPHQLGTPLAGHAKGINAVAFSPHQHILATASDDHTVLLWDVSDPAAPHQLGDPLTGHTGFVWTVTFAPDGHILATTGADHTVLLWDVSDPAAPRQLGDPLTGSTARINDVAFAPDGHILATAGDDGSMLLWDVSDPAAPHPLGDPLTGHGAAAYDMAFAPDGQTLATVGADGAILWDVSDPAAPRQLGDPLTASTAGVNDVAFASDGQTLATAGDDGTISLWVTATPAAPRQLGDPLTASTAGVNDVAFAPDGHILATAGDEGTVLLWDVRDPAAPRQLGDPLTASTAGINDVAFAPDGHILATAGADGSMLLWDVSDPAAPHQLGDPLTGLTAPAYDVAFAPDGHTLATAGDGTTLWDVTDPAAAQQLGDPLPNPAYDVAFTADGRILATVGNDGTVLWDVSDPVEPQRLGDPFAGFVAYVFVEAVAFAPDGQTLATASDDGTVLLWDVRDPAAPQQLGDPLTASTAGVNDVAFAPDGHILATASDDGSMLLWDTTAPATPLQLSDPLTASTAGVNDVAFAPDGHILATGGNDGTILWGLNDLKVIQDHAMERACAITGGGLSRTEWARYVPGFPYADVCGT